MFTTMTFCDHHGTRTLDKIVCFHIAQKIKDRIRPEKVFVAWYCSGESESPWWIHRYCDACVEKHGLLAENCKYRGKEAETKCDEVNKKMNFTGVCGECLDEMVGRISP